LAALASTVDACQLYIDKYRVVQEATPSKTSGGGGRPRGHGNKAAGLEAMNVMRGGPRRETGGFGFGF
jgi:hypothetical protein